jgi:hypothetical protein
MPKLFSDPEAIVEDIIRDVGTNLVVGLPLGLGKANHQIGADVTDDILRDGLGIGKQFRHILSLTRDTGQG